MSSVDFLADLGPSADVRAVARVLSAASAPPWPHELRGYEAARRAFESAGSAAGAPGAGQVGATPIRHSYASPLRRLIGVKLAAVAGALTVTGVAVAAEADVLPSPIQRAAHQMLGGVGVPDPDPASRSEQPLASSSSSSSGQRLTPDSARPSGDPSSTSSGGVLPVPPSGTADTPGQSSSSAFAPDALNLCRAYVAHQGDNDGNGNSNGGLSGDDRHRLAELAGGEDKIADFCARVLGGATTGGPVPQPSGEPTTPSGPTTPTPSPDPTHDHKPNTTPSTKSSAGFGPATTSSSPDGGDGHSHTPDPSRSGHRSA